MKRYRFVHTCIASTYEDISAMLDTAETITRKTFLAHVDESDRKMLERDLGYGRDFPISRDWHVSYHKGVYRGVPAYWFTWSGIEHVFTLDGELGPSSGVRRNPKKLSEWTAADWRKHDLDRDDFVRATREELLDEVDSLMHGSHRAHARLRVVAQDAFYDDPDPLQAYEAWFDDDDPIWEDFRPHELVKAIEDQIRDASFVQVLDDYRF